MGYGDALIQESNNVKLNIFVFLMQMVLLIPQKFTKCIIF